MARGGRREGAGRKPGTPGNRGPQKRTLIKRERIRKHAELTADRVIEEIRRLSLSDIGECFDEKGRFKSLQDMPPAVRACISSVKVTTKNLTAGDGKQEEVLEIKLWDKLRALEMAAKYHGLLTEKLEVTGAESLIEKVAEARKRLAASGA